MESINPPSSKWNHNDDVVLKNAVEAGASLESLARGAVEFSQTYTYEEIRDRWLSLLYDPTVSSEFIDREAEVGRSKAPANHKRKHDSVRRLYYVMHCRNLQEMLANNIPPLVDQQARVGDMMTMSSPVPELDLETMDMVNQLLENFPVDSTNNDVINPFIDSRHHGYDFGADGEDNLHQHLPTPSYELDEGVWTGVGCSSSMAPGYNDVSGLGPLNVFEGVEHTQRFDGADAREALRFGESNEDLLANFSNRLLNISEDKCENMEADDTDPLSQSYLETFSSLVSESNSLGASGSGPELPHQDSGNSTQPPAVQDLGPGHRNGVINCTLNEEVQEIPDNKDVFLPYLRLMPPGFWRPHWLQEEPKFPFPSPALGHSIDAPKQGLIDPKGKDVANQPKASMSKPKMKVESRRVKFALPKPKSNNAKPAAPRIHNPEHAWRVSEMNAAAFNSIGQGSSWLSRAKAVLPYREGKSDQSKAHEGGAVKEEEEEADVPCFSDVEEMILDMDLVPDQHKLLTDPEVQQLQLVGTSRKIVRLEQTADSCLHRVMAARGAFALLFGHFSWDFIKKPEVLIGRAVGGVEVDIDLGRLEAGAKVSRRQAVIKLSTKGTFMIKNVGRTGISVNGVNVPIDRWRNLSDGCIIEIRGLDFIFKINHQLVHEYLNSRSEAPKC